MISSFKSTSFYKNIRLLLKGKKPASTIAFGFDIYQNIHDIIDYSSFKKSSISSFKYKKSNFDLHKDEFIFSAIANFCSSGTVALDIGANIGLMSLLMAKINGSTGKVFSFEPGPISYALLQRNVYTNLSDSLSPISTFNIALSSVNKNVPLFLGRGESDNQVHLDLDTYSFNNERSRPKLIVEAKTLDSFSNIIDFDNLSFIKIDTQGHEFEILKGASSVLKPLKDIKILCEFCPYLKAWNSLSIESFYSLISSLGFIIYDTRYSLAAPVELSYLTENYGFHRPKIYTDLLLSKKPL